VIYSPTYRFFFKYLLIFIIINPFHRQKALCLSLNLVELVLPHHQHHDHSYGIVMVAGDKILVRDTSVKTVYVVILMIFAVTAFAMHLEYILAIDLL